MKEMVLNYTEQWQSSRWIDTVIRRDSRLQPSRKFIVSSVFFYLQILSIQIKCIKLSISVYFSRLIIWCGHIHVTVAAVVVIGIAVFLLRGMCEAHKIVITLTNWSCQIQFLFVLITFCLLLVLSFEQLY